MHSRHEAVRKCLSRKSFDNRHTQKFVLGVCRIVYTDMYNAVIHMAVITLVHVPSSLVEFL